jgi:predicted CoA-binding protein
MKAVLAAISETASRTHVATMGMTHRRSRVENSAYPPEYFQLVNYAVIVINPGRFF